MHRVLAAWTQTQGLYRSDVSFGACIWGAGRATGCGGGVRVRLAPRQASDEAKALSQAVASGPPGILGFGFGEEEIVGLQQHFEPVELRVVSGAAACRKGATLADAVDLLSTEPGPAVASSETGEHFVCFSRVVIFCGLPGEVIEGLIEVWPADLCESDLISFAYFAESMAGGDLEGSLLKIIKASDAHDMEGVGEDGSEESERLQDLRELLKEVKNRKNGKNGKDGARPRQQINGVAGKKGFGR